MCFVPASGAEERNQCRKTLMRGVFGGVFFFFIFPRDAVSGPGLSAAVELPRRRIETAGREVRTQQTVPRLGPDPKNATQS